MHKPQDKSCVFYWCFKACSTNLNSFLDVFRKVQLYLLCLRCKKPVKSSVNLSIFFSGQGEKKCYLPCSTEPCRAWCNPAPVHGHSRDPESACHLPSHTASERQIGWELRTSHSKALTLNNGPLACFGVRCLSWGAKAHESRPDPRRASPPEPRSYSPPQVMLEGQSARPLQSRHCAWHFMTALWGGTSSTWCIEHHGSLGSMEPSRPMLPSPGRAALAHH